MPARSMIAKEMAEFLGVLSHPQRVRIVVELREKELDVNSLQTILGTSHSAVSQHLALLRAHRIVKERRDGRHVNYSLQDPDLAAWLLQGLRFLEESARVGDEVLDALVSARQSWTEPEEK